MKRSIWKVGIVCAVMASGCAYQHQLLVNPEVSISREASLNEVKQSVHEALADIGWSIEKEEPGATTAHLKQDNLYARIVVEYTKTQATVRYLESKNFNYSKSPSGEERIHSHYLLWANHIAHNIRELNSVKH